MLAVKRVTPIARKPITRKQASLENSHRLVCEAWQAIDNYYQCIGEEKPERVIKHIRYGASETQREN